VSLGTFCSAIDVCSPRGRARGGLPVRREWIIQVPGPAEEQPLRLPDPEPEAVPEPEEAPA
jgi:hypothetical protein